MSGAIMRGEWNGWRRKRSYLYTSWVPFKFSAVIAPVMRAETPTTASKSKKKIWNKQKIKQVGKCIVREHFAGIFYA